MATHSTDATSVTLADATVASGRLYHVFVSHASKDWQSGVEAMWRSIGQLPGVHIFVAEKDLEPGQDFWLAIFKALIRSDTVLLVWTDNAARSRGVRLEANIAFGLGKDIVPIKADNTELPDYLKHIQQVDPAHIQRLVRRRLATVRLNLDLQRNASRTRYSLCNDEEEFYRFGSKLLRRYQRGVILTSGTPALILPSESRSPARGDYYERLSARIASGRGLDESYYLFKLRRTSKYVLHEDREAMQIRMTSLDKLLRTETGLRIYGVEQAPPYLPSGILGSDEGAILLRDPWSSERLIGVYFVTGRELESLRSRIYIPLLRSHSLYAERSWFALLQSLLKN